MKKYYYLSGKEQIGPFLIDDLKLKNITGETLIWTEGMENWKKLKDEKELYDTIFERKLPPPPPPVDEVEIKSTQNNSEETNIAALISTKNPKKTRKFTKWIILWCSFHLFALLMSYSQIDIFNDNGTPRADKLWPFVEYVNERGYFIEDHTKPKMEGYAFGEWKSEFYGVFNEYDWTEFALYAGGSLIIFALALLTNKKEDSPL